MDGFQIHISEEDFKSKDLKEQNWMTFKAIEGVFKCVETIDQEGCQYAKNKKLRQRVIGAKHSLILIGSGIGGAIIVLLALYEFFVGKG